MDQNLVAQLAAVLDSVDGLLDEKHGSTIDWTLHDEELRDHVVNDDVIEQIETACLLAVSGP